MLKAIKPVDFRKGANGMAALMMIFDLHRQGLSVSAIARACEIDRKTIRKYIERGMEAAA